MYLSIFLDIFFQYLARLFLNYNDLVINRHRKLIIIEDNILIIPTKFLT